jgi:hypothetical protein
MAGGDDPPWSGGLKIILNEAGGWGETRSGLDFSSDEHSRPHVAARVMFPDLLI